MKTYNGTQTQERRKKRVFTPIIYFGAELTLVWLLLSIVNISFDILKWSSSSHIIIVIATVYFAYKTYIIYNRQKNMKPAYLF